MSSQSRELRSSFFELRTYLSMSKSIRRRLAMCPLVRLPVSSSLQPPSRITGSLSGGLYLHMQGIATFRERDLDPVEIARHDGPLEDRAGLIADVRTGVARRHVGQREELDLRRPRELRRLPRGRVACPRPARTHTRARDGWSRTRRSGSRRARARGSARARPATPRRWCAPRSGAAR